MKDLVAAVTGGILILLLIVLILLLSCCCSSDEKRRTEPMTSRTRSLHDGIAILHQQKRKGGGGSSSNYFNKIRRVTPSNSEEPTLSFKWSDHPSLITDAIENGWSRFAFTNFTTSSSSTTTKPSILGLCKNVGGDYERDDDDHDDDTDVVVIVETSWEVCNNSVDSLQKIRLNYSGSNKMAAAAVILSVVRTALPLPGPVCFFPQEAYFEIKILGIGSDDGFVIGKIGKKEGEKVKLIEEYSVSDGDELKMNVRDDGGKNEGVVLCLGLSGSGVDGGCGGGGGGSVPLRLPGSYCGSVGFNSNGSVYVDGIKLVHKTEKDEWGIADKVIGCGFDPRQKNVFFTVDSQLVHVIHCKSEEFGTPMYPTLAANADITVLVNFGQSVFEYAPANAHRTQNPCFIACDMDSLGASLGSEDSNELFSMGRLDAQWLNRHTTKSSCNNGSNHNRTIDFDQESDTDLFEIVLDSSSGRSRK